MSQCNVYESEALHSVLNETLRPGGYTLTKKAAELCHISKQDHVLDLGCGSGATVAYLMEKHKVRAVGIDPSEKLLSQAKRRCPQAEFILGKGDSLPFADGSFDVVFAECTLSLMEDIDSVLDKVRRVLKKGGHFVVSDIYARVPYRSEIMEKFGINSCIKRPHDLEHLKISLENRGMEIKICEDCSELLKELMVKIIFQYGSMNIFWDKSADSGDGRIGTDIEEALKACKPGYFFLIGRKGE